MDDRCMDQIVGMFTKVPTHDVRARHRGLCIQHERIASQSISPLFVRRLLSACALICVDALQSPYLEKNRRGLIVRGSNIEEVSVSRCGISGDGRFVSDSWLRGVIWSAELRECGILRDQQSAYQRILVVETVSLGRALILDGALQCAERDERGYAEFLAHIPLLRTGARESGLSVLILGGGDGHVAREVLRHPGVSALTLVDIDECVVAAARDLLPTLWPPSLDQDRRFKLIFADGCDYVKSSVEPGSVDLVIVDASDPIGPGVKLYEPEFYAALKECLRPDGAVVAQAGSYWYLPRVFRTVYHGLKTAGFPVVKPFSCFSAVYPGGQWNLACATFGDDPAQPHPVHAQRFVETHEMQFYDPRSHAASFALPPLATRELAKAPPPLKEAAADLSDIYAGLGQTQ